MSAFPIEDAIKPECDSIRADLLAIEKRARALELAASGAVWKHLGANGMTMSGVKQEREMTDHARLAFRAIEDARMRIGKVLQYARDGVSCFDAAPGVTP